MRIRIVSSSKSTRRGSAVLFVLMLLSIVTVFVTTSFVSARMLQDELRQIEKRQKQRIGQQPAPPNVPAKGNSDANAA